VIFLAFLSVVCSFANEINKEEVLENPTLKTLSGALDKWSFYSNFTYRGSSIESPLSGVRPNIRAAEEAVTLVDLSGLFGIKYRLTKNDNLSLQTGLYALTPFHSSIDTDDPQTQFAFDHFGQQFNLDNPTLSYFRTWSLGKLQNISLVQYTYVTEQIQRDFYALRSSVLLSQSTAYRLSKSLYIAARFTHQNAQYDSDEASVLPRQVIRTWKADVGLEWYFKKDMALRYLHDVFSERELRMDNRIDSRVLQQTLAYTYFFNRDISIAPSIRFIAEDIRDDRTNIALNLNINI
jgi:hypothetical protein